MNQSELEANTCSRRQARETRAGKSRLVLVLILIGQESDARLFSQSQTVAMHGKPKQLRYYFRHSIENRSIVMKLHLLSSLLWVPGINKLLFYGNHFEAGKLTGYKCSVQSALCNLRLNGIFADFVAKLA